MIESLFPGKTKREILKLLLFSREELHLRDIARRIKITPIFVKKELDSLEKVGLVKKRKKANLSLYIINRKSKLYRPLIDIFVNLRDPVTLLKSKFKDLKADFVFIFGSYAKGKEKTKSDIDLFVVGKISENKLLKIIQDFEIETGKEVNYILWPKKLFLKRAKKHHLLKQIARRPIIVLKGDEDELKRIIK